MTTASKRKRRVDRSGEEVRAGTEGMAKIVERT
jgi:hypothetical protein